MTKINFYFYIIGVLDGDPKRKFLLAVSKVIDVKSLWGDANINRGTTCICYIDADNQLMLHFRFFLLITLSNTYLISLIVIIPVTFLWHQIMQY